MHVRQRDLGLDWMFDDPMWSSAPDFDDVEQRTQYYEMLLAAVRAKTADEWQAFLGGVRNGEFDSFGRL